MEWEFECICFVPSLANMHSHWTKKKVITDAQKSHVWAAFVNNKIKATLPVDVYITRTNTRKLDSDNLQAAIKHIRDAIANELIPGKGWGRADDDPRIGWHYDQINSHKRGFRVKIVERGP